MADHKIKSFIYRCSCGYTVSVYVDFGTPQERIACRRCQRAIERRER